MRVRRCPATVSDPSVASPVTRPRGRRSLPMERARAEVNSSPFARPGSVHRGVPPTLVHPDAQTDEPWQPDAVVLLAHGSRDPLALREMEELRQLLASHPRLAGAYVEYGVLEFPVDGVLTIQEAFDRCVRLGAQRISAVPLVFFAGGHGTEDLPAEAARAQARHAFAEIRLAPLLGIDDGLLQEIACDADRAFGDLPPVPRERTAVMLVTSGSAGRAANADVYKAARLLSDLVLGRLVEVAFLRLSRPYVQHAAARCVALGARQVVVAPLLLNTGLLARRVPRKLRWIREQYPDVEFRDVPHLGLRPAVIDLLLDRACATAPHNALSTPVFLAPGRERCRPLPPARARPGQHAGATWA